MAWLDYVNEVCSDICDAISAKIFVNGSTESGSPRPEIAFVPIRSVEKPKDDTRRVHETLCYECLRAQEEQRRLRGVIEQLRRDYEEGKRADPLRRYGRMKGMIKRGVLHLKLAGDLDESGGPALARSSGAQKEEIRQREEHVVGMSTHEIAAENLEMQEQLKEYKRTISVTRDLIRELDRNYENSKRYMAVQRYRLMKTMIKSVIDSKWL